MDEYRFSVPVFENYVRETVDEKGHLLDIQFDIPEDFNFGFDVIDYVAARHPDKRAMLWVSKDHVPRTFTFGDMKEYTARAANLFRSLGIRKGDRVLLILKRHYQFWFSICGLHKLGAIAIPATNQLMTKDLVYRIDKAEIDYCVTTADDNIPAMIEEAEEKTHPLKAKLIVNGSREGWHDFNSLLMEQEPFFPRPEGKDATLATDIMLMYFTSGTNGYPKVVAHDFTYPIGHITTARWWHNVQPKGLHLTVSDSGWGKCVWGKLYGQWFCEAGVFVYDFDRFHPDDLLTVMSQYQITTFCAPPTIYRFLIKEDLSQYDLSSIKYATLAGEALNPEVFRRFYLATGLHVMEGFGQTETTLSICNMLNTSPKPGSMGRPNPQYDVEVINPDGQPTEIGEVGEIVIRVGEKKPVGLFASYYKEDEAMKKAVHDGYYHTGDTAWRDEDGYFWYVGRTDDVIKSSGYRIGPFEIESVLMEHPAVLECAVTGAPDPIRGQVVKATIVLTRDYQPSEALKKEIQVFVKHLTAPYKYPRIVEFVKELPKTASGKICRNVIRAADNP